MKIKRQKKLRRHLNFYKTNFQFRSPLQVLIDSTFCHTALENKVNLRDQLPKYLNDDQVKLFTTSCVIHEAELLGPKAHGAMLIVKQFKTQRCGHQNDPIHAQDCLYSMVEDGNMNHYILATTDPGLTRKCRELLGVPILYLRNSAMTLEEPSKLNKETAELKNLEKLKIPDYQEEIIKKLKQDAFGEEETVPRKRKKIKGPNPLSCKKKKIKPVEPQIENVGKRKKKRNRGKKKGFSDKFLELHYLKVIGKPYPKPSTSHM